MQQKKLLMISTDRALFQEGSAVRARQAAYGERWSEVHIIVFGKGTGDGGRGKGAPKETVIAPNCWAYSTHVRMRLMHPFAAMRLGRFLIEKRGITDITCQDPFLTAMAGVGLKKEFPQVRLELQIHTDIGSPHFTYSIGNKVRKALALSYVPKADHIRVVSDKIKSFLVDMVHIADAKIEVRPIHVDTEKIKTAPIIPGANLHEKYPQFEKIVLMASRLEKEKNISLAISAWQKVAERVPKAGLIIVGSGSEKSRLKSLAIRDRVVNASGDDVKLGIKSRDTIIFEEWVDQMTLYSYYKTADLFLNTSLFEGYGMTLVEAHAAGCPIISTDVGVAREVGATIIPWGDADGVAEAVVVCLNEK